MECQISHLAFEIAKKTTESVADIGLYCTNGALFLVLWQSSAGQFDGSGRIDPTQYSLRFFLLFSSGRLLLAGNVIIGSRRPKGYRGWICSQLLEFKWSGIVRRHLGVYAHADLLFDNQSDSKGGFGESDSISMGLIVDSSL